MKLMVTGTREGMTIEQWKSADKLARKLLSESPGPHEFRHGDCSGADTQMHTSLNVWRKLNNIDLKLIGYPATGNAANWRAWNIEFDDEMEPAPPMTRNRRMVDASDVVIAAPKGYDEVKIGSGTWGTIRYAKSRGKKLYIVSPDGTVHEWQG